MNELRETLHLKVPLRDSARPIRRELPTVNEITSMRALGLSPRPEDLPLTIGALSELISDLRERVEKLEARHE